jgi:hypothetical protein
MTGRRWQAWQLVAVGCAVLAGGVSLAQVSPCHRTGTHRAVPRRVALKPRPVPIAPTQWATAPEPEGKRGLSEP